MFQIHRFRDKVALCVPGATVYLSEQDAVRIAAAMRKVAKEIREQPDFCKSTIGTFRVGKP